MSETKRMIDKNFGLVQFKYNRWSADLEEYQTLDDALDPTFWRGIAEKIMGFDKTAPKGRCDIIEVRKRDTGLYAELLIVEIGLGYVKTVLIAKGEPATASVAENSPLIPKWNPGKKVHEVIRATDKQVMQSGFQSKASAVEWIDNHLKAMAA